MSNGDKEGNIDQRVFTGDVLITSQGSDDDAAISELLAVLDVGREETLKQSGSRIEHSGALTTGLHSDMNLLEVNKLGGDLRDLSVTATSEVGVAEESSQLVGLKLNDHVREG